MLCCIQVANKCKANGSAGCHVYCVDLSQSNAVEHFANAVLSDHKHVDVLVNYAGLSAGKLVRPLTGEIVSL